MGMLSGRASRAVAVEVTALLAGCNGGSASEVDEACVPDQEVVRESGLVWTDLVCGDGEEAVGGTAVTVFIMAAGRRTRPPLRPTAIKTPPRRSQRPLRGF